MKLAIIVQATMLALYARPSPSADTISTKIAEDGTYEASIGIVNHTDRFVDMTWVGNEGGGHSSPFHAGVADVCCVTMPRKWFQGLKLDVKWDVPDGRRSVIKTKIVDVEKYEASGSVYLHFFPNDEVRIVVTDWYGGSAKHPIAPPPRTAPETDSDQ